MTAGFVRKKYNMMYVTAFLGWLVYIIGAFADAILAGIFISEDAVSATGLVTPIYGIIFAFSMLFGVGFGAVYSRIAGAFEVKKSHKVAGMALLVGIVFSVVSYIGFIAAKDLIFGFFDVNPQIESLAREYYDSIALITFVCPIYDAIYYLVNEDGDVVAILMADIIGAVANPIVSIFFVQIWGIRGLAYGTIVTTVAGGLCVLPHFFKKSNSIKFSFGFDVSLLSMAVKSGSAIFFTNIYVAIIDIVMNKFIIDNIGDVFLPAYTIVNLILNLGELSACAIDSAGPFVSISYGEKNPGGIRKVMRISTMYNLIINCILVVVFLLISNFVPNMYGIETPEIREAAVYTVRVLSFTFITNSIVFIWINYFPRVEKIMLGNLVACLYMLITPICCAIPLGLLFGYKGMVWGFLLTSVLTVIIVSLYIVLRYKWKLYPYVIEESENDIYTHELVLCDEEIAELNVVLDEEMKKSGVETDIINKVELMVEESFNIIKNENPNKKIHAECSVMIDDEQVQLVTRDNGKIFDITKIDEKINSLGHYVVSRLMQTNKENIYLTSISFNRNCYRWGRTKTQ